MIVAGFISSLSGLNLVVGISGLMQVPGPINGVMMN